MIAVSHPVNQAGELAQSYRKALRRYLGETGRAKPAAALKMGREAVKQGLDVLALAKLHEQTLVETALATELASVRHRMARRAAAFFAEAIVPIEATHRTAVGHNAELKRLNRELEQRTRALSSSHRKLKAEIGKRQTVAQNLRKSQSESSRLLRQSRELQEDLRRLSHQLLTTQEVERKRISRELHDFVARTLTSIHEQLNTLKTEAANNAVGMQRNITRTQQLVKRSVDRVHRFARELRPAVLDDLGLIPALRALVESFAKESGIRVNMTTCPTVEDLNNDRRTVLYRVAQEALTNVARHARADSVTVNIQEDAHAIWLRIHDNGRSFDVERLLRAGKSKRMGLLGMRERVEMVGGRFAIASTPGTGTTVSARVPLRDGSKEVQ